MTLSVPASRSEIPAIPREMICAAARCWRAARDTGESAQQRLHALLAPQARGLLAPVFDSLLTLWEAALGRRIVVGATGVPSEDEDMLVALITGAQDADTLGAETQALLDPAIRSTRVMLALS